MFTTRALQLNCISSLKKSSRTALHVQKPIASLDSLSSLFSLDSLFFSFSVFLFCSFAILLFCYFSLLLFVFSCSNKKNRCKGSLQLICFRHWRIELIYLPNSPNSLQDRKKIAHDDERIGSKLHKRVLVLFFIPFQN